MRIDAGRLAGQLASAYAAAQDAAASHRAAAASMRETASGLGSGALQGAAYSALGARLSAEEAELAGAMADYAAFLASCLDLHASALSRNLPEGGCFDTAQIEEDIRALNRNIAALDYAYSQPSLLDLGPAQCDYRWPLRESVRVLEDRLARAYAYAAQSASAYSALPEVAAIVGEGIARAGGMAYGNGRFYSPGGFGDGWRGRLGDAILRETEARFLHGGEYDWDAIGAALARPAGEISAIEYSVLARLLAKMDLDDTARFVQRLAERVTDVDFAPFTSGPYSEWRFDADKLNNISAFLLTDYVANLPEMHDARDQGFIKQQDYCMKLALLASLPSLGTGLGNGIRAPFGAEFPPIELKPGSTEGDVVMQYEAAYDYNFTGALGVSSNSVNRHGFELTLTGAQPASKAVVNIVDALEGRLSSGLGIGPSDAVSLGLSLMGFIPYAGDIASLCNIGLSGQSVLERLELEQDATARLEQIKDLSAAYEQLGFKAVVASSNEFDKPGDVYLYEGYGTNGILGKLNTTTSENGIAHSLGSPITSESVLANADELLELNDALTRSFLYDDVYNS